MIEAEATSTVSDLIAEYTNSENEIDWKPVKDILIKMQRLAGGEYSEILLKNPSNPRRYTFGVDLHSKDTPHLVQEVMARFDKDIIKEVESRAMLSSFARRDAREHFETLFDSFDPTDTWESISDEKTLFYERILALSKGEEVDFGTTDEESIEIAKGSLRGKTKEDFMFMVDEYQKEQEQIRDSANGESPYEYCKEKNKRAEMAVINRVLVIVEKLTGKEGEKIDFLVEGAHFGTPALSKDSLRTSRLDLNTLKKDLTNPGAKGIFAVIQAYLDKQKIRHGFSSNEFISMKAIRAMAKEGYPKLS